jgi:hypothetical protein
MTFKYNPGFSSDEDLISAFVVREKELQQILQTLQENTGRTYQHLLLVGARGTGKTMLVRRVAAEVRRSEPLNQHWYPLVFGEESYRILSAGEFWLEAIYHLAAQNPGAQWQGVYEELRGEKDEKILLIVENLNMLFDEQMSDGDDWDLRHTLQNEPRLMLLGTATQRFDEIYNIDKALFEFFAIYDMEPLKLKECNRLWKSISNEDLSDNQIRPMQILTGGNPRLLNVLAGFAKDMSFRDLMRNLTKLIDDHTDYFKGLIDHLPAMERKILIELLEIWKPANTNSIANAARMDVNKTSAFLNRLLKRGVVELVERPGREKYYQVAERLLNIYYLMRKRGNGDRRVKIIVDFMTIFYQDIIQSTKMISKEAFALPSSERKDHISALNLLLAIDNTEECKIKMHKAIYENSLDYNYSQFLIIPTYKDDFTANDIDLIIETAAAGYANQVLSKLVETPVDNKIEPLIIGLQLFLGENQQIVAQEIFEIGKDVAERIHAKQNSKTISH